MSYTKGEWKAWRFSKFHNWKVSTGDDNWFVDCGMEGEANAHLIAAAVNTCIKVNPDNPMAVAESINDMYEALRTTIIHPQSVAVDTLSDLQCRAELKRVCDRIDNFKDIANKALSKARG